MEYPAYTQNVADRPEYVEEVRRVAKIYEVSFEDAMRVTQQHLDHFHTGALFGSPDRDPYDIFITHAIQSIDPFNDARLVHDARRNLYKASLKYWARQGGYNVSEVWEWFDALIEKYGDLDRIPYADNVWTEFKSRFAIKIPRTEDGLVDATKLDQMTDLQRALIASQSAEVAETCALGGGDDTWFDYLPNGILTLASLQSEEWATVFADYIDKMATIPDDDDDLDIQMDVEEKLAEDHGFFIMDVTSHLVSIFLEG